MCEAVGGPALACPCRLHAPAVSPSVRSVSRSLLSASVFLSPSASPHCAPCPPSPVSLDGPDPAVSLCGLCLSWPTGHRGWLPGSQGCVHHLCLAVRPGTGVWGLAESMPASQSQHRGSTLRSPAASQTVAPPRTTPADPGGTRADPGLTLLDLTLTRADPG